MILAVSLVTNLIPVAVDQFHALGLRMHGLGIHLHAPDRRHIGASPVKIHPSIIVHKLMGIPEIKASLDLLVGTFLDIFRAVEVADLLPFGSAKIYIITDNPHVRRIVVEGQIVRQALILPVSQVLGHPDAQRHGRKDVILSFKPDHGRIRSLSSHFDAFVSLVIIKLIPVIHIDRIAEIVHPDFLLFSQTYLFINSALSWKDFTGDLSAQFLWLPARPHPRRQNPAPKSRLHGHCRALWP